MRTFKRNDARLRKKIVGKYGLRRKDRVNQLLHKVSKAIVQQAKKEKAAVVFEDLPFSASYTSAGIINSVTIAEK